MKSDPKVIDKLNDLLMDELTAVNQYIVHSEMFSNWGYVKLAETIKKHAITEMKHAEALIERILLMGGKPYVSQLKTISIGQDTEQIIANNLKLEYDAKKSYNDGIEIAVNAKDNVSRELMEDNLEDEENDHIDYLEAVQDQIKQMGIENFLSSQN